MTTLYNNRCRHIYRLHGFIFYFLLLLIDKIVLCFILAGVTGTWSAWGWGVRLCRVGDVVMWGGVCGCVG